MFLACVFLPRSDALEISQDPQSTEESEKSLSVKEREVQAVLQAVVANRDRVTVACLVAPPDALNGQTLGSLSLAAQVRSHSTYHDDSSCSI